MELLKYRDYIHDIYVNTLTDDEKLELLYNDDIIDVFYNNETNINIFYDEGLHKPIVKSTDYNPEHIFAYVDSDGILHSEQNLSEIVGATELTSIIMKEKDYRHILELYKQYVIEELDNMSAKNMAEIIETLDDKLLLDIILKDYHPYLKELQEKRNVEKQISK